MDALSSSGATISMFGIEPIPNRFLVNVTVTLPDVVSRERKRSRFPLLHHFSFTKKTDLI